MNETLVTRYIAAWMWHLIAIIFFNSSLFIIMFKRFTWLVIVLPSIILSEYFAWKRKEETLNLELKGGKNAEES